MHWRDAVDDDLQKLVDTPRLGLVTDMDGTISPIVDIPDAAQVTPRNRELLEALQPYVTLIAVVSGRAVSDVRKRVALPELVYVGNHGLEWWVDDQVEISPEAQAHRPALEAALQALQSVQVSGMQLEDKGATLSIHYRQTSHPSEVEADFTPIIDRIAKENDLNLFNGRMVFELRPPIAINKGSAFRQLIERYQLDAALYLGDDTTDADALLMARQLRQESVCESLGLGVIASDTPQIVRDSSDLSLSSVSDVEDFLDWLFKARKASST